MQIDSSSTSNSWAVVEVKYDDGTLETHVLPLHDIYEHEASMNCSCEPDYKHGAIVHNAFDKRELYERGERKLN